MAIPFNIYVRRILKNKLTKLSIYIIIPYLLSHLIKIPILMEVSGFLLMFLPGFLLTRAIFGDVELIQSDTLIFTIALSIALISLIMLTLNYSGLGMTLFNVTVFIILEVLLFLLLINYVEFKSR